MSVRLSCTKHIAIKTGASNSTHIETNPKAMTDKQKFYRLLSDVCEFLPTKSIKAAISAGYNANAVELLNVRRGRVTNLNHLVALIRFGLPKFSIPTELLPERSKPSF